MNSFVERLFSNTQEKLETLPRIIFKVFIVIMAIINVITLITCAVVAGFGGFIGALVGCAVYDAVVFLALWLSLIMVAAFAELMRDVKEVGYQTNRISGQLNDVSEKMNPVKKEAAVSPDVSKSATKKAPVKKVATKKTAKA